MNKEQIDNITKKTIAEYNQQDKWERKRTARFCFQSQIQELQFEKNKAIQEHRKRMKRMNSRIEFLARAIEEVNREISKEKELWSKAIENINTK